MVLPRIPGLTDEQVEGIAQLVRQLIAESNGIRTKRVRGEPTGNPPYGYRATLKDSDGKPVRVLVEDPGEQEVLGLIREARRKKITLRQIAEALNERGYRTRRGTDWRFQYVDSVLKGTR